MSELLEIENVGKLFTKSGPTRRCEYISLESRVKVSRLPLEATESDRLEILDTGRCSEPSIFCIVPNSDSDEMPESCIKHVGIFIAELSVVKASVESISNRDNRIGPRPTISGTLEDDLSALGVTIDELVNRPTVDGSPVRTSDMIDREV